MKYRDSIDCSYKLELSKHSNLKLCAKFMSMWWPLCAPTSPGLNLHQHLDTDHVHRILRHLYVMRVRQKVW
jgi:hypothetical protein